MDGEEQREFERMIESPIRPLILRLAVPTIISMTVTGVYNTADTYFVSQLGTSASAAVGVIFSLMAMIQAIGFTLGTGAASVISRSLGARDLDRANRYASSSVAAAFILGCLTSLIGYQFVVTICRALGATATVLPYAAEYAAVILLGAPLMTCACVLNTGLRAEGKAKFAMAGLASGGVLNIFLDPLFIFTFGLGIRGAAIATVLSQAVSLAIMASWYRRGRSVVRHRLSFVSKSFGTYLEIIELGSPSFCRQGLASLGLVMLNIEAAVWGDAALSAVSIAKKIIMMAFMVGVGIGQGYQPVVGYNYGAGRWGRVRDAFLFVTEATFFSLVVLCSLIFLGAPSIMRWFIHDPQVVSIGTEALRWQSAALPLLALNLSVSMTCQSVGQSWNALALAVCRSGLFFIPLVLTLPRFFGLTGLVAVQAVSDVCSAFISVPAMIAFLRGVRRRSEEAAL